MASMYSIDADRSGLFHSTEEGSVVKRTLNKDS